RLAAHAARCGSAALVPREYAAILPRRPRDGFVRSLSARDSGTHVRKHERRDDFLNGRRERSRVTRKSDEIWEVLQDLKLGIRADDRHRLSIRIAEERHVVTATAGHAVLPVVGEVLEEFLGGWDVFGKLPDRV